MSGSAVGDAALNLAPICCFRGVAESTWLPCASVGTLRLGEAAGLSSSERRLGPWPGEPCWGSWPLSLEGSPLHAPSSSARGLPPSLCACVPSQCGCCRPDSFLSCNGDSRSSFLNK